MHKSLSLRNDILDSLKIVGNYQKAYESLSQRYRHTEQKGFKSKEEVYAYLLARMPATFDVCEYVLSQIEDTSIESILDLGAGPGTATLAASALFSLKEALLIEQDAYMNQISNDFLNNFLKDCQFQVKQESIEKGSLKAMDLVVLSYVLGEMTLAQSLKVLYKAFSMTKKYLVIILPGTPKAYKRLCALRDEAIKNKFFLYAPCPHIKACPLFETEYGCHFSKRVQRTKEHMHTKKAIMGYEDEPFCYLILSKSQLVKTYNRVIAPPHHHSGHTILQVCSPEGDQKQMTISKKDKSLFKRARHLKWGDII